MSQSAAGILHTTVTTDQQMPLGFEMRVPAVSVGTRAGQGDQIWVYVFNDEAATAFAAGDIVVRDPSVATNAMYGPIIAASGTAFANHAVVGVAQHAIAAGSYGFVLKRGQGLVKNGSANITADTAITSGGDRAGAAIDIAAGNEHCTIGMSLEAEATDNTTFDAYISVP